MPIETEGAVAHLMGRIGAEEAEALTQWLREQPGAAVDLSQCEHVHAAALQALMALQPRVQAAAPDPWLNAVLGQAATSLSTTPTAPVHA